MLVDAKGRKQGRGDDVHLAHVPLKAEREGNKGPACRPCVLGREAKGSGCGKKKHQGRAGSAQGSLIPGRSWGSLGFRTSTEKFCSRRHAQDWKQATQTLAHGVHSNTRAQELKSGDRPVSTIRQTVAGPHHGVPSGHKRHAALTQADHTVVGGRGRHKGTHVL